MLRDQTTSVTKILGDMNPMQNSYTGADINRSAVSTPMEVEPEKIRKWREDQQKKIEQKGDSGLLT